MAIRRVVIDDPRTSRSSVQQGESYRNSGRSNMKRICAGCGEPSEFCKKIKDEWTCGSCEVRGREAARPERMTREDREIKEAMTNDRYADR